MRRVAARLAGERVSPSDRRSSPTGTAASCARSERLGRSVVSRRDARRHRGGPGPARAPRRGDRGASPSTASTSARPTSPARTASPSRPSSSSPPGAGGPTSSSWPTSSTPSCAAPSPSKSGWPSRCAPTPKAGARCRSQPVEVRVDVDNAASAASTVVDVRAEDDRRPAPPHHRRPLRPRSRRRGGPGLHTRSRGRRRLLRPRPATGGKVTDRRTDRGVSTRPSCRAINAPTAEVAAPVPTMRMVGRQKNSGTTLRTCRKRRRLTRRTTCLRVHSSPERMPCRKPHIDAGGAPPAIIG